MPNAGLPLSMDAYAKTMKNAFILIVGLLATVPRASAGDLDVLLSSKSYTFGDSRNAFVFR